MRSSVFVLFVCLASLSFGTLAVEPEHPIDIVRICDIHANRDAYIGKVVTIKAVYSTDSMIYAYFTDPSCSSKGVLEVGFVVPERDSSVNDFEKKERRVCRRRGNSSICLLDVNMVVRGEIVETVGAHLAPKARYLVINLHSVLSAEFLKAR